jgi:hypothetical protein
VIDPDSPLAARVIYNHFGGREGFPLFPIDLMKAVAQANLANYAEEIILVPTDWTLINFVTGPQTGLSRFGHFDINND